MLPWLIPAISAGTNLLGNALNASATTSANNANIAWQREAMNTQRQWALQDWNRMNEYNSPEQLMERYQKAGLSKMLVTGGGASNVSAPIRSTDIGNPNIQAKRFDFTDSANAVMGFYNLEKTKVETDKIKAMADLIRTQQVGASQDNSFKYDSYPYRLGKLKWDVDLSSKRNELLDQDILKRRADVAFTQHQDLRNSIQTSVNMYEAMLKYMDLRIRQSKTFYETEVLKAQKKRIEADTSLKQYEIKLNEGGMPTNINEWLKLGKGILLRK